MNKRRIPIRDKARRAGFAWLELLFALSILILVCQLFPRVPLAVLSALDLRTWTAWSWFAAFGIFLVYLCIVRFAPEIMEAFREQRERQMSAKVKRRGKPDQKKLSEEEERKLYQRMIEARKRQVF